MSMMASGSIVPAYAPSVSFSGLASGSAASAVSAPLPATTTAPGALTAFALLTGDGIAANVTFQWIEGLGTYVSIAATGLTNTTGMYPYHIHTHPITGDCNTALGHLDPLMVGDGFACPMDAPWLCQEGDLSGKHGYLMGTTGTAMASYTDQYVRFYPQDFSILGRSVVIHASNMTDVRLACGNITTLYSAYDSYENVYPTMPPVPTATLTVYPGGATNTSALSLATLPHGLPPVSAGYVVQLGSETVTTTIAGTAVTTVLPFASNVPNSFVWTSGAALPTDMPVTMSSAASSAASIIPVAAPVPVMSGSASSASGSASASA